MSAPLIPANTGVPSHRACAQCRSQKVRCIASESNPDVCERCARCGRSCIFTPLQKRKQRKRTDTRVAELEREMRSMQSMLKHKEEDQNVELGNAKPEVSVRQPAESWSAQSIPNTLGTVSEVSRRRAIQNTNEQQSADNEQQRSTTRSSLPPQPSSRPLIDNGKDVIERDILSMATARQLFETYRKDLFPYYPLVPISESVSADEMRNSKPLLFLAIIAAAAGKDNPDISVKLDQEVLHAYARNNLIHSQKSLEIIQALVISAIWYYPPNKFAQLKYTEYVQMAANMAMDIGIGSRSVPRRNWCAAQSKIGENLRPTMRPLEDPVRLGVTTISNPEAGTIEGRRALLSCYCVCTGVSMSTRRPSMFPVSSYVRECLDYFECSSDALPTDRMVVAWVRLLMIVEEIGNAFLYHDPGGIASIAELRTQLMLKDFAKRLDDWFNDILKPDMSSSLTMYYWSTRLYLHEVALHTDHSPEDFQVPFQLGVVLPWEGDEIPTQVLAENVAECVSSSHNLIDAFLAVDVANLCALPVMIFVRVSLAAFVLAKLSLSIDHPESQIRRVLERRSLKAESILERAILRIKAVLAQKRCRLPSIFLALLFRLRQWCLNPESIEPPQGNFLDVGLQNPIEGEERREQAQSNSSTDGPTSTKLSATDESSSQTSSDGLTSAYVSSNEFGNKVSEHSSMEPSEPSVTLNMDSNFAEVGLNVTASNSEVDINPGQVTTFGHTDQMELDPNFFQFFGAMDGLMEGNMNGLDDWYTVPYDLLRLPPNFSFQNDINDDEAPIL